MSGRGLSSSLLLVIVVLIIVVLIEIVAGIRSSTLSLRIIISCSLRILTVPLLMIVMSIVIPGRWMIMTTSRVLITSWISYVSLRWSWVSVGT